MTTAERLADALKERYRIERELGQGGMATVFLAEDVRHHRNVAIKVLHPELSAVLGSERFLKEIELTANLQHPHILPLFDSGVADGLLYYVMPYVEGETLRGRLERERQLPLADAIRIASDVADALDYAHRQHVIHRDIKPENILLLDGRPVVADFGIALAVEQAAGTRMTQTGMSLGTPQYMAPEQAMGDKSVDHRVDIYALGAVTFEMLAGEPPFVGPTPQAIVARVITERPRSLTAIRETVPPEVDAAVYSALQKLPADRPASAREFARALNETPKPFEFVPAERITSGSLAVGAVLTALLFGLAGYAIGYRTGDFDIGSPPPSRLAMMVPNLGGTGIASLHRQIAMTPDGSAVVYVTQSEGGWNAVAYQSLDSESPTIIPGSRGLIDPLISPDGRQILGWSALPATGTFRNVSLPIKGGTPTELPADIHVERADVRRDGTIFFTARLSGALRKLKPGENRSVEVGKIGNGMLFQQLLSDERRAFIIRAPLGTSAGPAVILDVETGKATPLVEGQVVEIRHAAGHVAYVTNDGSLWAAPFDEKRGTLKTAAVKIGTGVSLTGSGVAQFAMADNGNIAYIPEEPRWLALVDKDGKLRYATNDRHNFHSPRFSPDGTRISTDFSTSSGRDVWILSLTRGTMSRATFDGDGHDATWTPDSQFITYTSFIKGGIFRTKPGGGATKDSLLSTQGVGYTGEWLPNGRQLVTTLTDVKPRSASDIGIIDGGGRGPLRPIIADEFQTMYPAVSPDGRWLAFVSDQSGSQEVYVRPLEGPGDDVQVSVSGGTEPVWSRDGRELFYRGNSERGTDLMAAAVRLSPVFDVLSQRTLFPVTDMAAAVPHANYDLSPDGRTFVMVRRSPSTRIVVIQNLPELLKSLRDAKE
jgi:eukaryotic-like serine/threonine-protein kinase